MKKALIEIVILLLVSCLVIFSQFNQVPKKLSWDEIEFTRLALSLSDKNYTPYSQLATGHSTLYFYIILLSFKIFGVTNFALRFPAALFGVGSVLMFYFIARTVFSNLQYFPNKFLKQKLPIVGSFNSYIPFLLSLILVTSRWYFNFARFSFEVTFLLFLELVSIFFLFKFLKLKKLSYLIPSSIFAGLAFLSYYPGRIFFLLPTTFIFFQKKIAKKYAGLFLLIVIVVTTPLLIYLLTHKDLRVEQQLFLTEKKLSVWEKIQYGEENLYKVIGMFNLNGDLNGRHNYPGKPALNPVIGGFFILGFLVTILHLKLFYNQFFLAYFLLSLFPTLLTYPVENPNSLRTYTAIVPILYFIGNGIIYLLQTEYKSKKLFLLVILVLLALFLLSSLYDVRTYFLYQKGVFQKAFELNGSIQRILNLKLWEKANWL